MTKNVHWKNVERALARRLDGRRTGATGRSGADVLTDRLSVEVKHRRRLPDWLKKAFEQADQDANRRLPVVILHEFGQRHDADLVLIRLADFESFLEINDG